MILRGYRLVQVVHSPNLIRPIQQQIKLYRKGQLQSSRQIPSAVYPKSGLTARRSVRAALTYRTADRACYFEREV